MHYYQFNIGDYRRDTNHLTLLEHGIYRSLIDSYYMNEGKLFADDAKLMRTHCIRTELEQNSYKNIINDFFELVNGYYIHDGCDKILTKIFDKSQKARESAQKRWDKDANAMRTNSESNADGMLPNNPLPNNPSTHNNIVAVAPKFNFKSALIGLGVNEKTVSDWLEVRRKKKAANTETAFNGLVTQINKSGLSADNAITMATERSWAGFKAEWATKNSEPDFSDTSTDWVNKDWGLM